MKRPPPFYLESNQFKGELPTVGLRGWTKHTLLFFSRNHFSGVIPDALGAMSLIYCILDENNFSGMLPWTLDKMLQMFAFRLSKNRIAGSLPGSISVMRRLEHFALSDNKFVGTLPEFGFKHLTALVRVDLGSNMFSHTLPEEGLTGMTRLFSLMIENNMIAGSVPEEGMMSMPLCTFRASSNQLTGTMPMVALASC
eukprot:4426494-Amphidinium_carterae.1